MGEEAFPSTLPQWPLHCGLMPFLSPMSLGPLLMIRCLHLILGCGG
jgi:hypothetical protein